MVSKKSSVCHLRLLGQHQYQSLQWKSLEVKDMTKIADETSDIWTHSIIKRCINVCTSENSLIDKLLWRKFQWQSSDMIIWKDMHCSIKGNKILCIMTCIHWHKFKLTMNIFYLRDNKSWDGLLFIAKLRLLIGSR